MSSQPRQSRADIAVVPSMDAMMEDVPEENDMDKIFKRFLDPANIVHLTDLSSDEILAFTTLKGFASQYELTPLTAWLGENLQLRVSKSRQGRKEFAKMAQRTSDYNMGNQRNWWDFRRGE